MKKITIKACIVDTVEGQDECPNFDYCEHFTVQHNIIPRTCPLPDDREAELEAENARLKEVVKNLAGEAFANLVEVQDLKIECDHLKQQLEELRKAVDSILCLAVEGPEACGYLQTITAITKVAEANLTIRQG